MTRRLSAFLALAACLGAAVLVASPSLSLPAPSLWANPAGASSEVSSEVSSRASSEASSGMPTSAAPTGDASASTASTVPESNVSESPAPETGAAGRETAESANALVQRLDQLLDSRRAGSAFWGVHVTDVSTGETIYSRNGDRAFLPASTQKLLTTATGLDILGSTYRYETALRFDGTTTDSVMQGDFVLDGSGDPSFGSLEVPGQDPLEDWAERLAEMGVRRVEGRLIGDDSRFNDRPYPEGWDVDYITRQAGRHMGISAGGLSYDDNVVVLKLSASRPGRPVNATVRPSGTVEVENRATTSSRWRGNTLHVERTFATNKLILHGSVARSYRGTVTVPVSNPTTFALQSFQLYLQEAGIETDLEIADIDDVESPPDQGDPLFVYLSPPLSELVSIINKESNNFYAEQLFRTYGWGGSARGGADRTETFLRRIGVDTRDLLIHDGSGLSRKDLVTPQAMARLLEHMDGHPAREAFLASLARGGENNTTLEYRLHREPIRAKTGSLQFVRALSGYAERPDGSRVAFAVFANNYTGPSYRISNTIDRVVRAITSRRAS